MAKTYSPTEAAAYFGIKGSNPGLTVRKVLRSDRPGFASAQKGGKGTEYALTQQHLNKIGKLKGWKRATAPRKRVSKTNATRAPKVATTIGEDA